MRIVERGRFQRGVLFLPSLFTLGNLFCGLFALRAATDGRLLGAGQLEKAALFIGIAMLLDGLDGKIARLAHATSPLGMQLDSLANVVSFGVAPGLLVYCWALAGLGNLGWAVALLFAGCGALRLARFNVQAATTSDHRYFVGLPIPGAAGAIAVLVANFPDPVTDTRAQLCLAAWTLMLAFLMVSTIRYHSFKQMDGNRRQPIRVLFWVVLGFAVLAWQTTAAMAVALVAYTASGPILRLLNRSPAAAVEDDDEAAESRA